MSQALDTALSSFNPTDVTVRVISTLLTVLPGSPTLVAYRSLEEAVAALHPGAPRGVLDTARELAVSKEVLNALLIVNALDTGDKGISMTTGLKTAASLFFGGKPGFQADAQQRSDAAVKAIGLASIFLRILPDESLVSARKFASLPSGAATLLYFGALEVALPFSADVTTANGLFLTDLWAAEGSAASLRLQPIAGKDGIATAAAGIEPVLQVLERAASLGVAHVGGLADSLQNLLPGALAVAKDSLPDIAATGVDSLPVYRYLAVRAIAEACCARARWMYEPQWQPSLSLPLEWFEPPAPAAPEGPADLPPNPFAPTPEESTVAPTPEESTAKVESALPANPFVDAPSPEPAGSAPPASSARMEEPPLETPPLKEAEAPTGGWWDDAPAPAPEKTAQTTLEKSQEPVAEPIPAVEAAAVAAAVVSSLEGVESTDWEGIYAHRAGRATLWVVLQPQGAFHQKPPVKVDSFGPAPATWRVENDRLLVKWSEEKEDIATISRSEHGILLDGNECRRVDHDFSGFALDGHWKGDTGEYDFDPDGKFSTTDGADGKYELGNRAITLVWNEGGSERLSFMCERVPGERAMVLYIAGEAFRRVE